MMISRPKRMRVGVVYAVLIELLAEAVWVGINAGYRHISLEALGQIVLGKGEAGARYTLLHLRLPRVLGRIGLAWMFAALLFVNFNVRSRAVIAAAILLVSSVVRLFTAQRKK